jgi:hypothetical protein
MRHDGEVRVAADIFDEVAWRVLPPIYLAPL